MKNLFIPIMLFFSLAVHLLAFPGIAESGNTTLPANYKEWYHIKSMIINEGHPLFNPFGGIHHIYANDNAIKGYKGGKFQPGSIIIFDLFEAVDSGNAIAEGGRKFIGVMEKSDSAPKTDGWHYEMFAGEGLKAKGVDEFKDCHECHSNVADRDYVFSVMK